MSSSICCISFDSYIKPQRKRGWRCTWRVVYLLIPTSNHNCWWMVSALLLLYIFWFLHQTTTVRASLHIKLTLYIFWFLHQTTTKFRKLMLNYCCISFDSYIKPQPLQSGHTRTRSCISFDSYIKPQLSKKRNMIYICCISFDSYIKPQPSRRGVHE